jgi:hypothetical protein
MNPLGKKFISLFLMFSLMMLSMNLYAKERRGAKLIVTKLDGQQIKGELITIKPNSLLLLDTEGKDVSVGIEEIKVIRVVKKSWHSIGMGMGIGGLIGAGIGALVGYGKGDDPMYAHRFGAISAGTKALLYGFIFMDIGGLLGGIIGLIAGIDKKIHLEGMSDLEIQETLDYLRKKARIRDYK